MLLGCLTVDATTTLRAVVDRIADEPDSMLVAIRRLENDETYWYIWTVADLRYGADRWDVGRVDSPLTDALDLHEYQAVEAYETGAGGDLSVAHGVLLRGTDVVGVLRPEAVSRGSGTRGGSRRDLAPPSGAGADGAAVRGADRKPFSAYPALTAPERVGSKQAFQLDIGLSAVPVAGVAGGPLTGVVPAEFVFELQVVADGFVLPDGSKTELDVQRDAFEQAHASVRLVAPDIEDGSSLRSTLEILFFYENNLCGRALRTVIVGGDQPVATPSDTTESRSPVSIPNVAAPDLTVMIHRGNEETRLLWTFASTHDVPGLPQEPVAKPLKNESARSFALNRVRNLSDWDKNSLSASNLVGIAEEISRAMPNEFWLTLDAIWEQKQAAGQSPPSVLIVSEDPYVPWELAATTPDYTRPERIDPAKPPFLGAQMRVGRWIPPVSTPFGGEIPSLPPQASAAVDDMVLFVGDYDALVSGQRPLPLAIEEGRRLATRYEAIQRHAVLNDVTDLVRDEIVEDGQPVRVDAIHFACHGEVSPNPQHNGIVLSDRVVRLGADMISGSAIGTTSDPFVFVNACQLGIETEGLDGNYGGLAGAFLDQGATGFVSPLWSVDDDIAQEVAVAFYERVYDDQIPVAEVMSELRSRFDMDSSSPRGSYLAYVYFGHPNLIITKS
jgi:hypothetical protein